MAIWPAARNNRWWSSWSGPAPAGDRLAGDAAARALHVFDSDSGRRIDPIGEENVGAAACCADTAD